MSRRSMDFKMKIPTASPQVVPTVETKNVMGNIARWIPLICAGAAVGVSVIALKEIHNMRKEISKIEHKGDEDLKAKIENMETQLNKISEFLKTKKTNIRPPVVKTPTKSVSDKIKSLDEVIKNAVESQATINIINENEKFDTNIYEEVEVTDSESEES